MGLGQIRRSSSRHHGKAEEIADEQKQNRSHTDGEDMIPLPDPKMARPLLLLLATESARREEEAYFAAPI
jgi:hypothetical protein